MSNEYAANPDAVTSRAAQARGLPPTPTPEVDGSSLHLLPADTYPGLLDDWYGPVARFIGFDDEPPTWVTGVLVERLEPDIAGPRDLAYMHDPRLGLDIKATSYLNLRRPECAHRVRDVLAAGVPCDDGCDGGMVIIGRFTPQAGPSECPACKGTGYRIAPADLGWTRGLPAWQAAAILAASVLRVVAGERVVGPISLPWKPIRKGHGGRALHWERPGLALVRRGWGVGLYGKKIAGGPETGEDGQHSADVAVLAEGVALDNDDHILIPLADGRVARVEAP